MRIGLDLRCLPADGSEGSGVAHAARALCSRLVLDRSFAWNVFLTRGSSFLPLNQGKAELDSRESKKISFIRLKDATSRSLRMALRQNPCDVLFVSSGAVSFGLGAPALPWIHDLTILEHPEWFPESWLRRQFTTRLVLRGIRRAPVAFAVSEYTKRQMVRHARISADRIVVTGEGGDGVLAGIPNDQLPIIKKQAVESVRDKWRIATPFVLALGTVEPRKNLAMLIRAWRDSGSGKSLVIAGHWGWKCEDVKSEIAALAPELSKRFYRIEKISDEDRRHLLLAAAAVAVPSLDEGFGLVALEAMQAGTPVIASNRGALPEVVGSAGALLDPEDECQWREAIARLVDAERGPSDVERPKIFNSVGLAAAVNALKGGPTMVQKSASIFTDSSRVPPSRDPSVTSGRFTWESVANTVLDALRRLS